CDYDSTTNEIKTKEYVSELSDSNIAESASINDKEIIVQDSKDEENYDLPKDDFFVSVAPYLTYTHPCKFHNLTGCQGELVNEEIDVKITDEQGKVYIYETIQTLENGFLDFWLPRDKQYTIEISYQDKYTEYSFSTFEGDSTCLTYLKLK